MITGLGFLIWKLTTIIKYYTPTALAQLLYSSGVQWVSWKTAEGPAPYNQIGGNDKILKEYLTALESTGIENGGWIYCYPDKPGAQAGLLSERIEKLNLKHILLDIEKEWKKPNLGGAIDTLLAIDVNKKFPIGFCSYRYPHLHQEINYARFFKHPSISFNAPQLYWMNAHNPVEQIETSAARYQAITDKPFIPLGSTFAYGQWQPTADDLIKFVEKGKTFPAYGFYSLDWLISHHRLDWLAAICGYTIQPPVQPPPPQPVQQYCIVTADKCNIRNQPLISDSTLVGTLHYNAKLPILADEGSWYKVELYVSKKVAR